MTETPITDAIDRVEDCLGRLRWLLDPEGTQRRLQAHADEALWGICLYAAVGALEDVPLEARQLIASADLEAWNFLAVTKQNLERELAA